MMKYPDAETTRRLHYMLNMKAVLNKRALFSDGTEGFRSPSEPKTGDTVRIRFRTQRNNVDGVDLIWDGKRYVMDVADTLQGFDYYETTVTMGDAITRYYFEIHYGHGVCCYNNLGPTEEHVKEMDFLVYPDYQTPDWAKGAVMYQIFVDRFSNGDPTNDVETGEYSYINDVSVKVDHWRKPPAPMGVREFYGGDLQGLINRLDYLQNLGVEVLYLNPIFVSPSNHKYDCQDYDYVDPHYGRIVADCDGKMESWDRDNSHAHKYIRRVTDPRNLEASNKLFIHLVEELHRRGMKIILDGVFNHCGSFNKWMDRERIYEKQDGYEKGAYISEKSPYRSYFRFTEDNWPYNGSYDGWWGHDTLPKLNYEDSDELLETILAIGRKWVSPPYNADGWRVDVAADIGYTEEFNHHFWKEFRRAVKEANPQAIILAEHYGSAEPWLRGDEWDTVMNYDAFMEPVTWFLTGMEKHSDEYREDMLGNSDAFISAMRHNMRALPMSSLYTAMNELSNHDHSRFLTRTNHKAGRVAALGAAAASEDVNPAVMREAVAIQMTWPGSPTVYYGDEAGVCGFTDPDNRRTYPWGSEDYQMIDFHREMIRIHKTYPVLKNGSLVYLWNDYQGLSYGRFSPEEVIVVVVNNQAAERTVEIEAWRTGISRQEDTMLERLMLADKDSFTTENAHYTAKAGMLRFTMPGWGIMILYGKR